MFDIADLHPSWTEFFQNERDTLGQIAEKVAESGFLPESERVLRCMSVDLTQVRVVILGQDPYPQPGAATGRSFEVAGLTSWTTPFRQTSLRNLVRAIHAAYTGELLPWTQVRARIERGEFPILPPDRLWDALEAQGVLFLNTYLTVAPGHPGSHRALWQDFSRAMVRYIDGAVPDASWFLWGSDARGFAADIAHGRRYESRHPMLCGNYDDDFLKNPCFRDTMDIIDWRGRQ